MNNSTNPDWISAEIKAGILGQLIVQSFLYKGSDKKILKFVKWRRSGIIYPKDFNHSEVPTEKSIKISVEFDLWVLIDMERNMKSTVSVNGHFGLIDITFNKSHYFVELKEATISRLSIG